MAPILTLLKTNKGFESYVCLTSQHKDLLTDPLKFFEIKADFDLEIMLPDQNLFNISVGILSKIELVIRQLKPDLILVQGDTTSAFIGALSGFYSKIRIGHVEAGLRTNYKESPYPEEINRQLISRIADIHFAPTLRSKQNLLDENIAENTIFVTGNTIIDALNFAMDKIYSSEYQRNTSINFDLPEKLKINLSDATKKIIVVTAHRRENFLNTITNLCKALRELSKRQDVIIVFLVHPNPNINDLINKELENHEHILLIKPMDYLPFVYLMKSCYFIMTDSGGLQEEAAALGKPVLVFRTVTERQESIIAGSSKLIGLDPKSIIDSANELLDNEDIYKSMAQIRLHYGDGNAAKKIVKIISQL
jgi:UDP-N-acetylglucosamine 2-epimerase (non-hydrolysing)